MTIPIQQRELATDAGNTQPSPALNQSIEPSRFRLYSTADFLALRPPPYLVRGLVYQNSLALLFAAYESFKTFLALDLSLHIATGTPFHGRNVVQAPVVFICGEGGPHNQPRVEAWLKCHKFECVPEFFVCLEAPQVGIGDEDRLIRDIEAAGIAPKLIVIDPISASNTTGKEAIDFSPFVSGMQRLRDRFGATVLAVHHTGWREPHPRGHTSLPAAMDLLMRIDRTEQPVRKPPTLAASKSRASFDVDDMVIDSSATSALLKVTCAKNRLGKHFAPMFLRPRIVTLDRQDEYGDAITSCVLVDADEPTLGGLDARDRMLLAILSEQLATQHEEWITSGLWHSALQDRDAKAWAVQKTFYRVRNRAIARGYVAGKAERGPYTLTEKGRTELERDAPQTGA
jgi:hypothetical protein